MISKHIIETVAMFAENGGTQDVTDTQIKGSDQIPIHEYWTVKEYYIGLLLHQTRKLIQPLNELLHLKPALPLSKV